MAYIPVVLVIPLQLLGLMQLLQTGSVPEEEGQICGQDAVLDVT